MLSICPVCNGCVKLAEKCPSCGGPSRDLGRADDYGGPYAPYRPIDELKLTNGFWDLATRQCVHLTICDACGKSAYVFIQEWVN